MLKVTIARGDGIGPIIMDATLRILQAVQVPLEFEEVEIGEKAYLKGHTNGINPKDWEIILKNPVFLKAPITTPQGGGYKSLNVAIRKRLNLYANVRPCQSYPFIETKHPKMNLVIIRENQEDLYAGVEYQIAQDLYESRKWISREGCEKIIRYAFEYARQNGRQKVTCMTKDNIMKMTDGLFHKVFKEIAPLYPDIQSDHLIIDIGAARLAHEPERFDVVVTLNLYGDIVSDITALGMGSVGLGSSANLGDQYAMFEAVHGSAPTMNPQKANPSGLILSSIEMLKYLGLRSQAARIYNAWFETVQSGLVTPDLFKDPQKQTVLSTEEFTKAICDKLKNEVTEKEEPIIPSHQVLTLTPKTHQMDSRVLKGFDIILIDSVQIQDVVRFTEALSPTYVLGDLSYMGGVIWPTLGDSTRALPGIRIRLMGRETVEWKHLSHIVERCPFKIHQIIGLYEGGFSQTQGL